MWQYLNHSLVIKANGGATVCICENCVLFLSMHAQCCSLAFLATQHTTVAHSFKHSILQYKLSISRDALIFPAIFWHNRLAKAMSKVLV